MAASPVPTILLVGRRPDQSAGILNGDPEHLAPTCVSRAAARRRWRWRARPRPTLILLDVMMPGIDGIRDLPAG